MKAEQTLRSTGRTEPDRSALTETLPTGFPEGVLPDGELVNAIRREWITAADKEILEASIQPASLEHGRAAVSTKFDSHYPARYHPNNLYINVRDVRQCPRYAWRAKSGP